MAVETGILIFLSFVVMTLAYLSTNMGKEHGALQILCLIIFFVLSTAGFYLSLSFMTPDTAAHGIMTTIANAYVFVLFVAVGYIMIHYLQKAFELW